MARHSSHLDEKMLQVGLKLIEKKGSKALTVREICRAANVNLGLFVYYFKNKDTYLKCLFEIIHTRLMHFVSKGMHDKMTPLEKMKHFYKSTAEYAYKNKSLLRMFFVESAIWSLDKPVQMRYDRGVNSIVDTVVFLGKR